MSVYTSANRLLNETPCDLEWVPWFSWCSYIWTTPFWDIGCVLVRTYYWASANFWPILQNINSPASKCITFTDFKQAQKNLHKGVLLHHKQTIAWASQYTIVTDATERSRRGHEDTQYVHTNANLKLSLHKHSWRLWCTVCAIMSWSLLRDFMCYVQSLEAAYRKW